METKKPAITTSTDVDQTLLADICKNLKVEPRVARRFLRNAEFKVDGGRWAWKKGSAQIAKVTKLLKDSQAAKVKK